MKLGKYSCGTRKRFSRVWLQNDCWGKKYGTVYFSENLSRFFSSNVSEGMPGICDFWVDISNTRKLQVPTGDAWTGHPTNWQNSDHPTKRNIASNYIVGTAQAISECTRQCTFYTMGFRSHLPTNIIGTKALITASHPNQKTLLLNCWKLVPYRLVQSVPFQH